MKMFRFVGLVFNWRNKRRQRYALLAWTPYRLESRNGDK